MKNRYIGACNAPLRRGSRILLALLLAVGLLATGCKPKDSQNSGQSPPATTQPARPPIADAPPAKPPVAELPPTKTPAQEQNPDAQAPATNVPAAPSQGPTTADPGKPPEVTQSPPTNGAAPPAVAPGANTDPNGVPHVGPASLYPNYAISPGKARPNVDLKELCTAGDSEDERHVTEATKKEVFRRYGIPWSEHTKYEVDHIISLELGGSNDIENLFPEPYEPRPGAHEKDRVENYLHRQVCQGKMTLKQAQDAILNDWYAVYKTLPPPKRSKPKHH